MVANDIYIGLMSGTSADAIDAVAVDFSSASTRIITTHSEPIPQSLRSTIHQISTPGRTDIDQLGELDGLLGELFSLAVITMLDKVGLKPNEIKAIGSHGQTIRHRPPGHGNRAFTLQIGDPNIIAHQTAITTVADFRRRDMAAGGQGAPLVPAFHQAVFGNHGVNRVIVNIGGISNITWIPCNGEVLGFDTGPGNVLMDAWTLQHHGKPYDVNGYWAASGNINNGLLSKFLQHPYFAKAYPKSTGREEFNSSWLEGEINTHRANIPLEDIQATLCALTAKTIVEPIKELVNKSKNAVEIYLCGGGAYNTHLIENIQALLPAIPVSTTSSLGIAPEWIEAAAFAWLARQTMNRKSGNLCAVTGASQPVVLGGIYYA